MNNKTPAQQEAERRNPTIMALKSYDIDTNKTYHVAVELK